MRIKNKSPNLYQLLLLDLERYGDIPPLEGISKKYKCSIFEAKKAVLGLIATNYYSYPIFITYRDVREIYR